MEVRYHLLHHMSLWEVVNGIQFAWEAFFPLFAFTSTELGGLGLGVCPPHSLFRQADIRSTLLE